MLVIISVLYMIVVLSLLHRLEQLEDTVMKMQKENKKLQQESYRKGIEIMQLIKNK